MKKNKIISLVAISLVWVIISIFCFVSPQKNISESERRTLKTFPKLNQKNINSGKFMADFEDYSLDQFPFRDYFRGVKSLTSYYALNKSDNNNIFIKNGYLSKLEYPMNKESIYYATGKIQNIINNYLLDTDCKTYISIIPDKNYYLINENDYPRINYQNLFDYMENTFRNEKYINIHKMLNINNYYRTDTHWKQETLTDIATYLKKEMNCEIDYSIKNTEKTADKNFSGVYLGQSALPITKDTIKYITNSAIENSTVINYETNENSNIYDFDKLNSRDHYDFFLSGPTALLEIENKNSKSDKELIIFRDSFSSSLAPLLIDSYKKITLVDIRYISSNNISKFIEFNNQDVLFLYSTIIFNNSAILK